MAKLWIDCRADIGAPPEPIEELAAWVNEAHRIAGDGARNIRVECDCYEYYGSTVVDWKVRWLRQETDEEEDKRVKRNAAAKIAAAERRKRDKEQRELTELAEFERLKRKFGHG